MDLEALLVSQPSYGEEALRIAEMLVKSNAVDIIVIDSVAALVPKNEIEERDRRHARRPAGPAHEPGAAHPQPDASARRRTCMIFINQIRQKIGVMFGNPETTTGGLALKFYASCRHGGPKRITQVKDGDETIGARDARSRW